MASLDQSLVRMGLDYVDVFYSHRYDPETPLEETTVSYTHLIHGRRVGIKLVQQHIAVVHHPVVLCEGNGLRFHDFYPVGVTCG